MKNETFVILHPSSNSTINEKTLLEINREVVELSKLFFSIGSGLWENHQLQSVCPLIKEWRNKEIFLGENKNCSILKEIHNISFPSLKQISLR